MPSHVLFTHFLRYLDYPSSPARENLASSQSSSSETIYQARFVDILVAKELFMNFRLAGTELAVLRIAGWHSPR